MPTVKGVFSLFASLENNRKFFCKLEFDRSQLIDHTSSEAANKIFDYILYFSIRLRDYLFLD